MSSWLCCCVVCCSASHSLRFNTLRDDVANLDDRLVSSVRIRLEAHTPSLNWSRIAASKGASAVQVCDTCDGSPIREVFSVFVASVLVKDKR